MSDKSRFRRGEFESRQRQLPADKKVRGAKGRAYQRARKDQENTPLGAPPKPVDVRSVYDTRPINAFDFNITSRQSHEAEVGLTGASPSFVVPAGFVCVLRELDVWLNPAGITSRNGLSVILQLNGGDVPYNGASEDPLSPGTFDQGIFVGSASGRFPVFLIANEFNSVGARLFLTTGSASSFTAYVLFYGQFLLKSGLPPSLEIGNPMPLKALAPSPLPRPAPELPPAPTMPSAPQTPITQRRPGVKHFR